MQNRQDDLGDFASLLPSEEAKIAPSNDDDLGDFGQLVEPAASVLLLPKGGEGGLIDTALDVASDIGTGVMEAPGQVLGGIRDAVQEANEAAFSLGEWLNENVVDLGQVTYGPNGFGWESGTDKATAGELPKLTDEPESVTGGLVRGVSQFLTGFIPAARALKVGQAATAASAFTRASVAGAAADATVFDPHEARLSNLVEEFPTLSNPVSQYLAADPNDSEAEGRFKNALEGLGLGVMAEGMVRAVRAVGASRKSKPAEDVFEEAAAAEAQAAPRSVDPAVGQTGYVTDPGGPLDGQAVEILNPTDAGYRVRAADGTEYGVGRQLISLEQPKRMAPITPEDEASPISSELISRGKAILEDIGDPSPQPSAIETGLPAVDVPRVETPALDAPGAAGAPSVETATVQHLQGRTDAQLFEAAKTTDDAARGLVHAELQRRGVDTPDVMNLDGEADALDRALREFPPTVAENIERGKLAIARVLDAEGPDFQAAAMWRDEVGSIYFGKGRPGTPDRQYRDGWGLLHIREKRTAIDGIDGDQFVREVLPDVVAKGEIVEGKPRDGIRMVLIEHENARVVLQSPRANYGRDGTWLVTGYEIRGKPGSGGQGGGFPTQPTHRGGYESPTRMGAEPTSNVGLDVGGDKYPASRITTATGRKVTWSRPMDLLTWLRSQGGIKDQAGELAAIDAGAPRKAPHATGEQFLGRLVNPDGMSLDDAARSAWEAGYFPEHANRPDVNALLDAIRQTHDADSLDLRRFTQEDRDWIDSQPAPRDVDAEADALDIDTAGMTEDQIADAIDSALQQTEVPTQLNEIDVRESAPPAGEAISESGHRVLEAVQKPKGDSDGRAGNIRLDKIQTTEDVSAALKAVAGENADFGGARRGVVSDDAVQALADDLGMTAEALSKRRLGQSLNAEELLASRQLLADSAEELTRLADLAKSGSDTDLLAFQNALWRHTAIQEQVSGAIAEAGRALRSLRMPVGSEKFRIEQIRDALMHGANGREGLQDLAFVIANTNDPTALNRLVRHATKSNFFDALHEYWINSILSGPTTHMVNMTSNSLTWLWSVPEDMLAAGFGALRGGHDRVFIRMPVARVFGTVEGVRDGFRAMASSLIKDEGFDALYAKLEGGYTQAIPGKVGAAKVHDDIR